MNQKIVFYLISIVLVFFIGYSYSQYNTEPPEPVIINLDNSDEIDQYKANISSLKLQLDDLDSQLISALDELKKTSKKLILSSSKVKVLEDEINLIQKKHDELEFRLTESDSTILVNEKEVIHLKELLANTLIELELSQFEIELLEEQL
jgi:predicted  nucleic acid-binding Zn-ribbon protein